MEKKLLMSAKNVTKQYPGTLALNDVSVDIYAGEVSWPHRGKRGRQIHAYEDHDRRRNSD